MYGAPAPHARKSATGQRSGRSPRRQNAGRSSAPAVAKRSAVKSHAVSASLVNASFVIAGKPPQINAAMIPYAAPASGDWSGAGLLNAA
jgi:hypothetical protein